MKSSLVSAAIHVVIVGLVVLITPRVGSTHQRPPEQSPILIYQALPSIVGRGLHVGNGEVCNCVAAPTVVPPNVPGVDVSPPVSSTDVGISSVDTWGGPSRSGGSGDQAAVSGPLSAEVVDVQVTPYAGAPTPRYPEALREAGIEGEVTLEFVVDTTGRVERGSVRVLSSAADAFVVSVRDALAATRYHPALVGDRPVRQLVRQGFVFALTQH